MVENDNISKNYIAKLTEKNKKFYIEKGKYIMNFSTKLKNENDKFRCKFYKDKSYKCKVFVEFNKEGKVVNYNNNHTCKVDEKN